MTGAPVWKKNDEIGRAIPRCVDESKRSFPEGSPRGRENHYHLVEGRVNQVV